MLWTLIIAGSFSAASLAGSFGPPIEYVELELLRPDGKSFALHKIEAPQDGEQVVIPDGDHAWQVKLDRHLYEGRLKICANLSKWGSDGTGQGMTQSCVVLPGSDTPRASTTEKGAEVQLRLTVERRKRP